MAEKPQDTKAQNGGAAKPESTESRHAHETAETARRSEHGFARRAQRGEDEAAGTAQHDAAPERTTPAMPESSRDMRTLFALAGAGRDSMQDVRDSVATLVEGVMGTNMRMVQELFRMSGPATAIELQHRFGMAYLDALLDSTAMLLRATRRVADGALRPLEQRRLEGGAPHGCVADVMETHLRLASPDDTVQHAAQLMRDTDAATLPVGEDGRLVGMVSGRDMAVRLVAEGRDPRQTRVREVMTPEAPCVFEDEDLGLAAENMAEHHMRHLPVVSRDQRLVGMVSLANLTRNGRAPIAARATT